MNKYEEVKLNENVKICWKETEYTKEGQTKHLTQLVLRYKVKDDYEPNVMKINEIVLSSKDNYKALYFLKVNNLA